MVSGRDTDGQRARGGIASAGERLLALVLRASGAASWG